MNKKVIKILLISGLVGLVVALVFICRAWRKSPDYSDFTPEFQETDWVLARGSGLGTKLFYKTGETFKKGEKIEFTFVEVNTKIYNDYINSIDKEKWATPPEKVTVLNSEIDEVYEEYVVFDMTKVNVDCFGIYLGSSFVGDELRVVDLGIMPVPSDYHYCEDFDWENGMVRELDNVESASGNYVYTAKVFEPYYEDKSIVFPFDDYERMYLSDEEVKDIEKILVKDTDLDLEKYPVRQYFAVEVGGVKKAYIVGLPENAVISGELNSLSSITMIGDDDIKYHGGFKKVVVLD